MSQYGLIYRLEFVNVEGFIIRTDIYPTDVLIPDTDAPTIIDLQGSGNPVIISASNNDEDKYTPIRSKSARITFRTDSVSGIDSATFSQGADDLWRVDIYLQDTPELIFTGFLMMADNQQPFQPDPQYLTLTATDHLAALKEVALVDYTDDYPIGYYRVADLVAMALRKTGLSLQIYVVNNLRAGGGQNTYSAVFDAATDTITLTGGSDTTMFYIGQRIVISGTSSNNLSTFVTGKTSTVVTVAGSLSNETAAAAVFLDYQSQFHWYDNVYMNAKTFEKEIGLAVSCSEAISKILGEDCFITQWKGNWWIMRTDEIEGNPVYVAEFDPDGTYVSTAAGTQYDYSVGAAEDSKFANADTLLRFVRPHGFIKETFNYNTPLEVPCNVNFSRGDLITDSGSYKTYDLDCWDKYRENYPTSGLIPATVSIYRRLNFNTNGYETERFVVIPWAAVSSNLIYSEDIPVNVNDKFTIGMTRSLSADVAGSGAYTDPGMQVRLTGDDGTFWTLEGQQTIGDTVAWVQSNSTFTTFNKYFYFVGNVDRDMTEPEDLYGITDAPPCPVSGIINLLAHQSHQALWNRDTYIRKVSFEYIPYINGSYQKYSGQYSEVDRTATGYMANRDKEVYISDSPTKLFKGAMFVLNNSAYHLIPVWFNAAPFGNSYPPDQNYLHPYGYIQAYSVWNQYKGYNDPVNGRGIGINIFQGAVYGLTDAWPDLLQRYTLTDLNTQTINRYFILISLQQDWRTCIWQAVFIEVYNFAIYKTYSDPFTFKYISE